MSRRRFPPCISFVVLFLLLPAMIVAITTASEWMPKVFGPDWYAAHGESAETMMAMAIFVIILAYAFFSFLGPMLSFFGGGPTERRIRKHGRPALGTIIAVDENSSGGVVTVNDQPYLNIRVRVEDGTSAPYEADSQGPSSASKWTPKTPVRSSSMPNERD